VRRIVRAIFEDGVFKPIEKIDFLKAKYVKLIVESVEEKEESTKEWAEKIMTFVSKGKEVTLDSQFAEGLSVRQYFTLTEEQREKLWQRWHAESEKEVEAIQGRELRIE